MSPLIFCAVVCGSIVSIRRERRLLSLLAQFYSGNVAGAFFTPILTASKNRCNFSLQLHNGGKHSPPHIEFRAETVPVCEIHFLRGAGSRFLAVFEPGAKVTCGDETLDRIFAITATDAVAGTVFLSLPKVKEALMTLAHWNVQEIEMLPGKKYIGFDKPFVSTIDDELSPQAIEPLLDSLITLATAQ